MWFITKHCNHKLKTKSQRYHKTHVKVWYFGVRTRLWQTIGTIRLKSFVILDVQRDREITTRVLAYVPGQQTNRWIWDQKTIGDERREKEKKKYLASLRPYLLRWSIGMKINRESKPKTLKKTEDFKEFNFETCNSKQREIKLYRDR